MSRELFGTDGVRGLAGQYPLDRSGSVSIGRAVGAHFAQPGQSIIIGSDPRESSPIIVENLTAGLVSMGVQVVQVGVITTPGLAYLTREGDYVAGVMVTASHNPYQYNGIKVFDAHGDKLPDQTEAILNKLTIDGVTDREAGNITKDDQLIQQYEDFLVNSAGDFRFDAMEIAIDSANGAASGLAQRVFERLGAIVHPLFNKPDGRNINDNCGATGTNFLRNYIKNGNDEDLDLGIALDGDADRLILADELGREINGDQILYILAVANKYEGVVATLMSNIGFEQALKKQGIKLVRTAVGDRYVLQALRETGYRVGGEQSGHVILPELLRTGDALLAAVQTLKAIGESNTRKTLGEWCDELVLLPQALVNVELNSKADLERSEVKQFIKEQSESLAVTGRLLIRPSGTEPLVRVMVEAPNAEEQAVRIANQLKELL